MADGKPSSRTKETTRSRKLERALGAAATVAGHTEHLVRALELLREAQAVTPEAEARLLASYETGSAAIRARLDALLEELQSAELGKVLVALRDEPEALREQGKLLVGDARAELQRFLDENRPTVEAVERASRELAQVGRELAHGLKGAGKEAADELVRRGKSLLLGADTEAYEQAVLDWAVRTTLSIERAVFQTSFALAGVFLVVAALLALRDVPYVLDVGLFVIAALLLLLAVQLARWGWKLRGVVNATRGELDRVASMPPAERREKLVALFRLETGADPLPKPPRRTSRNGRAG